MPKLKPDTVLPSPEDDAVITAAALADPDAQPFTDAQWQQVAPLVRRGRPAGSGKKEQVTLRLDTEVLNYFRSTGSGWQTRANEVLLNWVKRHA